MPANVPGVGNLRIWVVEVGVGRSSLLAGVLPDSPQACGRRAAAFMPRPARERRAAAFAPPAARGRLPSRCAQLAQIRFAQIRFAQIVFAQIVFAQIVGRSVGRSFGRSVVRSVVRSVGRSVLRSFGRSVRYLPIYPNKSEIHLISARRGIPHWGFPRRSSIGDPPLGIAHWGSPVGDPVYPTREIL